uniref:Endoplasmic reticulum-Golgi intermediate compartment protein n=1 Tax=Xenopus laevis TaxID=8355 RepID=Q66J49_XENLA|nr:MGC81917 protein [Xenopus laevis]
MAFSIMGILTIMEFLVYRDTRMKYEYEVDKDFTSKIRLNIDITVAMKCQYVGADVLDLAETMVTSAQGLAYQPVSLCSRTISNTSCGVSGKLWIQSTENVKVVTDAVSLVPNRLNSCSAGDI